MKNKKIIYIVGGIIIACMIGIIVFYNWGISASSSKDEEVIVTIEQGSTASQMLNTLEDAGLVNNKLCGQIFLKLNHYDRLQANTYVLNKNMSLSEIFSIIEKIQDEENKPLMDKLNLFLKTKEEYYAYFLDGRINIGFATRELDYSGDNLLYCETSKYKDYEISCALHTLFNTAIMNVLPPIKYIAYLIETLGSEEEVELDKLLPWSKEIESLYEN